MLEKEIEARLVKLVKEKGGLCYKFESPGNIGVPDRIVITPSGEIYFVELKTETGQLQKIQEWQIDRLKKCKADVRILKGITSVEKFVKEVLPL